MKLLIASVVSFIGLAIFIIGLINMLIFVISSIIITFLLFKRSLIATGLALTILSIYIFGIINVIIFTVLIVISFLTIINLYGSKFFINKMVEFGHYCEDARNKNYHKIYSDHQYFSQIATTFNELVTLKRTFHDHGINNYSDTPGNKLLMARDAGSDISERVAYWMNKNDPIVFFDICHASIKIDEKYLTQYKNVDLAGYTIYSFIATINYDKFDVPDKNKEIKRLMRLGHKISAKDRQVLNYMFLVNYGLWLMFYVTLIEEFNLPKDIRFTIKKKFVNSVFTYLDL